MGFFKMFIKIKPNNEKSIIIPSKYLSNLNS